MRFLMAIVAGAVVLFAWGAGFWTTVGDRAVRPLAAEDEVMALVAREVPEDGAYFFPAPSGKDQAATDAWTARHRSGPLGMLIVSKAGRDPMDPKTFIQGGLISVVVATLLLVLMRMASPSGRFANRFAVAVVAGVMAAIGTHGLQWNWFFFPTSYTMYLLIDIAGSWTIAGAVMAIVMGRPKGVGQVVGTVRTG
jgi:hypothetical protein